MSRRNDRQREAIVPLTASEVEPMAGQEQAELRRVLTNRGVRYRGQTGQQMLRASFSTFDPTRTFVSLPPGA